MLFLKISSFWTTMLFYMGKCSHKVFFLLFSYSIKTPCFFKRKNLAFYKLLKYIAISHGDVFLRTNILFFLKISSILEYFAITPKKALSHNSNLIFLLKHLAISSHEKVRNKILFFLNLLWIILLFHMEKFCHIIEIIGIACYSI